MTTPFIPPPELLASDTRLQQSIENFANQLDQDRISIPTGIMDHINASSPDPEDLQVILAWNGRVFNPTDFYPREAIKAVCSLPLLEEDITQWWLDQVNHTATRDHLYYQQILPERNAQPTRTTLAAFGIIRAVLKQHNSAIPALADIPRIAGTRLSHILFTYARLRHVASSIAAATFPPMPEPAAAAATLAPSHPDLIVDIGRIEDAHHMANRQDWLNHDMPPVVCPTCDVWIANDMLDLHHSTDYGCPYCWSTPIIQINREPYLAHDNPVDQIFADLAPQPYCESWNLYRRVAGLSALTPSQAYALMHNQPKKADVPAPCPLRTICATDCAQSPLPFTNSGTNKECLIVPFLERSSGMSDDTKTEYARQYLQNISDENAGQRRSKARARKAQTTQVESTDSPQPVVYTQPTLL